MNDPAAPPPTEVTLSLSNPSGPDDPVVISAVRLARLAGTLVAVVGLIGVAAGVWVVVRAQQLLGEEDYSTLGEPLEEGPSLADRLDTASQTMFIMVLGATAVGVGIFLRLFGQYLAVRATPAVVEVETETDDSEAEPQI